MTIPYLNYCNLARGSTSKPNLHIIVVFQKRVVRIVEKSYYNSHTELIFKKLNLLKWEDIHFIHLGHFMSSFTGRSVTWSQPEPLVLSRLDYWLISNSILNEQFHSFSEWSIWGIFGHFKCSERENGQNVRRRIWRYIVRSRARWHEHGEKNSRHLPWFPLLGLTPSGSSMGFT